MNLPETLRLHAPYLDGHPDGVRADRAALIAATCAGATIPRQSPPVTREEIHRAIVGSADPYNLEESIGIMHSRRVAAMVDRVYALIEGATP